MISSVKYASKISLIVTSLPLIVLSSCQSTSSPSTGVLQSAAVQEAQTVDTAIQPVGGAAPTSAIAANNVATQQAVASNGIAVQNTTAFTGQACTIQLAGGPPPKPPRGADFGSAVVKNTGNAVKRGIIQNIGARFGGGLGASIAGGVAQSTIRSEQDIKGVWNITDGSPNCACQVSVDSLWKLKGKGADKGFSKLKGCVNPDTKRIANWALGYSFSGYGSKFELKHKDKRTVVATMTREGIHYFTGTMSNGTPVTMWREKQTFNQLPAFNKSIK